jgi:hypothetical protein
VLAGTLTEKYITLDTYIIVLAGTLTEQYIALDP